jgi:hypothetical protein
MLSDVAASCICVCIVSSAGRFFLLKLWILHYVEWCGSISYIRHYGRNTLTIFRSDIYIKHWLDNKEIIFYERYVDDILIVYDQRKTNEQTILYQINKVDKNLQFKISTEKKTSLH